MPTYEFTCPQGHDFDKFFRSMASAPTVVPCPVCGEPADRQMSAGAGLVFHGSGFYITDYGKDGKKDQKNAGRRTSETKDSSAGESKTSGSSESGASESKSDSSTASSAESKSAGDSGASKPAEAAPKPAPAPKASE